MKTQKQWFNEYAKSHQNKTNQIIHYVCVPAIYFSIVGLIMSIPSTIISSTLKLNMPIIENWASVVFALSLIFYFSLSFKTFLKMLLFGVICIVLNYNLSLFLHLFYTSLAIFVIAWVGQFYGHKLEGKKPSFLKDLQFLLIGPAWVFEKLTRN